MGKIEVIGLGALNVDHIYKVERILTDGEAVVNRAVLSPGGSAANTIYGLAKLGVATGFIGAVGEDAEGKILLRGFRKICVDTSQIKIKPRAKTGSVLCLSDRLGRRSLYVVPGANNRLTTDDLDLAYINQARWLHLSSFAGDRQVKVSRELIDSLQVSISFAPGALYAAKGLKALTPILARTHILFINRDEIQQLTGQDIIPGAETCLERGCHTVAVTLGRGTTLESGKHTKVNAVAYIKDGENEYAIQLGNMAQEEVDTTGAGDAFATGFLYGLLNGKGLEECGRLGGLVAQFSITKIGARAGLPTPTQLSQRYQVLYSQQL